MSLTETIDQSKKYLKISKASSGYLEVDLFKNADLNKGYFCYNCLYYIKDNKCSIVQTNGPDVNNKESGVIAAHGVCTLWYPNESEMKI